jgi:leader peptidase (prepilin peptidase)/N-methyltransferase
VSSTELVLLIFGTLAFLAVGSFTCVVIDRLPLALDQPNEYGELWDTRPWPQVLGGSSRCSHCGTGIRVVDNVPVLSYVALRGRCRGCGASIPGFHPLVELLCPLLFLGAVWSIGADWRIMPALWLIPVGVAVAVIDLRTLIVPTRIVWPAFGVLVALSVASAAIEGEWAWLLTAAIGLAALAGPLFALWFVLPASMGFGDVRLTVLLGWAIGFYAGTRPLAGVVIALICLVLASVLGLAIGIVAIGARGRKAQVPFGPALVLAAFLCIAFAEPILDGWDLYSLV